MSSMERRWSDGSENIPKGPWTPTHEEEVFSAPFWEGSAKYSRWTSYILIGICLSACACGLVRRVRRSGARGERLVGRTLRMIPGSGHILALIRALTYQTLPPSRFWSSPSVGSILLIASFSAAILGIGFGCRPWYFRNHLVGSPPLAIRGGMMAISMFPWFWTLALKVNPFTWLTGVSHEKLQVYHQWLARLVLFFSWVHTIPFLWQWGHDGAPGSLKEAYDSDYQTYASGVACLVIMMWMTLTSTSFVRRLGYEFFIFQHLVCTLGVIILMFIHSGDLIDSWRYLWATIAAWGASTLIKWARMFIGSTFACNFDATIETICARDGDEGVLRIAIKTPLAWAAGQHVFVRFPTVNPLTSHPFTIASLAQKDNKDNLMVLVARVRDGQTKLLYDMVRRESRYGEVAKRMGLLGYLDEGKTTEWSEMADSVSHKGSMSDSNSVDAPVLSRNPEFSAGDTLTAVLPAMIDGPYGEAARILQYPSVLLLAGGVGITRIMPAILDAVEVARKGNRLPLQRLHLVWAVSSSDLVPWFGQTLSTALAALKLHGVEVQTDLCVTEADAERAIATAGPQPAWRLNNRRPDVRRLVRQAVDEANAQGHNMVQVSVCGPHSFGYDASSAAARVNLDLFLGRIQGSVREVVLDSEHFAF